MHAHKFGARAEYRIQQGQRVVDSPTLAVKYRKLKSLRVSVGYYAPEGATEQRQLTYDVNLANAKSVLRLDCSNGDCVQGDHELTKAVATAVAKRRKFVEGELRCQGWLSKDQINKAKCNHLIRYKLKLAY
jgi:hypothetical protein